MIGLYVEYFIKPTYRRGDFFAALMKEKIAEDTLQEGGCESYRFLYPAIGDNSLVLLEAWQDAQAQAAHKQTQQFVRLQKLKDFYVEKTILHPFGE